MFRMRTFNGVSKFTLLVVCCAAQIAAAPNTAVRDITYSIYGHVADASSADIVDVSISDGAGHTTSTDSNGNYTLSGLDAGTYTITPSKSGYTFLPVSLEVIVPPDGANQDFTAQEITYSISGNAGVGGAQLSYFDGTSKNVVADGNGDYSLTVSYDWSGTVAPSKANYTFSPVSKDYLNVLVDQPNENYTATQNEYTLTVTSTHGTVVKSPNQATYHEGAVVELTAAPNTGWSFANWAGDLSSSLNPDSVTVHGNTTVTANYTQNEYILTITSAHGTVVKNPDQATYHEDDVVQLTATPNSGWSFTNWTGDLNSNVNPDSITIHGNSTVTANYSIDTSLLSISRTGTGSGTVTSSPVGIDCGSTCSHAFDYNTGVTLTAAASTGSTFTGWSGGGCSGTGTCSVTMTSAATVTANFTLQTPTLTVGNIGTGGGTVTSNPSGINCGSTCSFAFNYNTGVTLTASASTGSTFTGWSGSGCSGTGTCSVTMTSAATVTANFNLQTPTLSVSKTGTGSGTVTSNPSGINCGLTCSHAFNYNTAVILSASASSGSVFAGWSGGGCSGTGTCSVTMTSAASVTASFSDTIPPSVSWIGPVSDGQGYDVYNQIVQLEVNASDNVGMSKVVFYRWDYINLKRVEIGTVSSPPYRINFDTSALLSGLNEIDAYAYDADNNSSSNSIWLNHLQMPILTVNKNGSGNGTVRSDLPGINCGPDCAEPYAYDQVVTLTPVAFAGSVFVGWSGGGCSGTGTCVINISTTVSINATFSVAVAAPTLQSPRTNFIANINKPTFSWMSVRGGESYEIVFATNSAFTTGIDSHIINDSPYTVVAPFGDGKYYWRVRAYNDSNQPGEWSPTRIFTVDTNGPSAPTLSSPVDNTLSKRTPTFKWLNVPTAVSYEFQYDTDLNFSSPIYITSVRGTFRRPPAMGIGIYYWQVRAKDAVGNWGNWSVPSKITITGP